MNTAFEGDTFIKDELIKLRNTFGLTHCVETGAQYGSTTIELKTIFKNVTTIEADEKYFDIAKGRFVNTDIDLVHGDSGYILYRYIKDNALFYLDAHGCEVGGCALKKELEQLVAGNANNICIAIHDFRVPGKDFGYDTYDYELCYEEIEPHLKQIYPDGYGYHFNSEADGARRGIVYIYPKK